MSDALRIVPDLTELLDAPERGMELRPRDAAAALARVEGLAAILRLRAAASESPETPSSSAGPIPLLPVADVATIFGKSTAWVHRQAAPPDEGRRGGKGGNPDWASFTVRDSTGTLLGFDSDGVTAYLRSGRSGRVRGRRCP
jgi:hypothetical protein